MTQENFVGIDISKDKFDAAILISPGKYLDKVFENTTTGIKEFHQWLKKHTQTPWVCMEATGCYGQKLADYLYTKKIPVSVVNPLKIKHYGRAIFMRNKNDKIDARLVAQFGQALRPRLYTPKSLEQKAVNDLVNLLNMLKMNFTQFTNQKPSVQTKVAIKITEKLISNLKKDIKKVENKLAELVEKDLDFKRQFALITSIKGVGKLTAYRVIARIQDISSFENGKQLGAFIGTAPRQCQSGKFQGKTRMSCLGDAGLRKALYMAAIVAKRHNPALQPFVKRLAAAGKAPKAIIGAVMYKLVRWIFAVLKHNKPFDMDFHSV